MPACGRLQAHLVLHANDQGDEHVVLGLGLAAHVQLLHAQAQLAGNALGEGLAGKYLDESHQAESAQPWQHVSPCCRTCISTTPETPFALAAAHLTQADVEEVASCDIGHTADLALTS